MSVKKELEKVRLKILALFCKLIYSAHPLFKSGGRLDFFSKRFINSIDIASESIALENSHIKSLSSNSMLECSKKIASWSLFSKDIYLRYNTDLASMGNMTLSEHFAWCGIWENRRYKSNATVARMLADETSTIDSYQNHAQPVATGAAQVGPVSVFVSSKGNAFMREIAQSLIFALRKAGITVQIRDESGGPNHTGNAIVVAPHEFFVLGDGPMWNNGQFIERAVMLCTEQPQTSWFDLSLPYILHSAGVIELCWQLHSSFRAAGVNSEFFIPGESYPTGPNTELPDARKLALVKVLPKQTLDSPAMGAFQARPIDVTFLATRSALRDEFFKRASHRLAEMHSYILYRSNLGAPLDFGTPAEMKAMNDFILGRSKILLNVHRDEFGYFEIHRFGMLGFANGCLVVASHGLPHPYFRAGEHYIEETIGRIPELLDWLVNTPDGKARGEAIRSAGTDAFRALSENNFEGQRLAVFLSKTWAPGRIGHVSDQ